jgi:hypothetical protein
MMPQFSHADILFEDNFEGGKLDSSNFYRKT